MWHAHTALTAGLVWFPCLVAYCPLHAAHERNAPLSTEVRIAHVTPAPLLSVARTTLIHERVSVACICAVWINLGSSVRIQVPSSSILRVAHILCLASTPSAILSIPCCRSFCTGTEQAAAGGHPACRGALLPQASHDCCRWCHAGSPASSPAHRPLPPTHIITPTTSRYKTPAQRLHHERCANNGDPSSCGRLPSHHITRDNVATGTPHRAPPTPSSNQHAANSSR